MLDLFFEEEDGHWVAEVEGSDVHPYQVLVPVPLNAAIDPECSCPVAFGCKHIAATLMAILDEGGEDTLWSSPPSAPEKARKVQQWLEELAKAASTAPARSSPIERPVIDIRFDLQLREAQSRPALVPYILFFNKTGEPSRRKPRKLGYGASHDHDVRLSGTREEKRWLREIELLDVSDSTYRTNGTAPEDSAVADLILTIAEAGKLYWDGVDTPALTVAPACDVRLNWALNADGAQTARLTLPSGEPVVVLETSPALWLSKTERTIGVLDREVPGAILRLLSEAPPLKVDDLIEVEKSLKKLQVPQAFWPRPVNRRTLSGVSPKPHLVLKGVPGRGVGTVRQGGYSYGSPSVTVPAATLAFNYDGNLVPADGDATYSFAKDGEIWTLQRDTAAERAFAAVLSQEGLLRPGALKTAVVTAPDALATFCLEPPNTVYHYEAQSALSALGRRGAAKKSSSRSVVLEFHRGELSFQEVDKAATAFVSKGLPRLYGLNWDIRIDPTWPLKPPAGPSEISTRLEDGPWGLRLGLMATSDALSLDLVPLVAEIVKLLPIDAHGALPKGFDLEGALAETSILIAGEGGAQAALDGRLLAKVVQGMLDHLVGLEAFHPAEAGRYRDFADDLEDSGVAFHGDHGLLERARALQRLNERVSATAPASFKGELRPYQLVGFQWLRTLRETQFGGVLADDMGLGKTIQALAFLVDLHVDNPCARPSLVVAPTSVVGAWRRAAERFAPSLKVEVLHGVGRHGQLHADTLAHVYVTTYALLHRDREVLTSQPWACVIADEAQAAKNPASNVAKRLRELTAETRIAVTGTPVENSLSDLWTLFDWAVPGLLGNRQQFGKLYRTPIEKAASKAAQSQLNARTKPFILRRTKEEVERELPLKTEITETVAMGEAQRVLYESVRAATHAEVRKIIAAKGVTASQISILAALLQLRQVCCDPRLLKTLKTPPPASAKFDRLFEMLESLLAEGRRIIVFSQFVEMLKLIRAEVQSRAWRHQWLDGATTHREEVVEAFQSGEAEIFLISLKAGGAGITLTAADTVILYDPWWNPQAERQAMDRVHRIGQNKPVFVYRLVTEGTVEQAIHQLQSKKQALADALFEGGSTKGAGLSSDDIDLLFRPAPAPQPQSSVLQGASSI